jgi:hypothetical protein
VRNPTQYGFTTENLKQVIPSAVSLAKSDDPDSEGYDMMAIVTACVNAIKQLHKMMGSPVAEANS